MSTERWLGVLCCAALIMGCGTDASLRPEQGQFNPTVQVSNATPALGEEITFQVAGLPGEYDFHAYLEDADLPSLSKVEAIDAKRPHTPVFRVGRLFSVGGKASVTLVVSGALGNDQYGDPFRLVAGKRYRLELEGTKANAVGTIGAAGGTFTIR